VKKPTGSVRFRFYKLEIEKIEPNRTQTGKTEPNQFEPVFFIKNQTETDRFEPVSVFYKKNFSLVTFFYKNQIEPKIIIPTIKCDSLFMITWSTQIRIPL
jgi:hypothetical protein